MLAEEMSLGSDTLWARVDVVLHFAGPLQETPEVAPLVPHKFPEFQESDLLHFDAAIGLDSP